MIDYIEGCFTAELHQVVACLKQQRQQMNTSVSQHIWRDTEKGERGLAFKGCVGSGMEDVHFERQFRTPYSEGYYITQGSNRLGSIDIHFTSTTVHGTLVLERELEESDIAKLIEQIDEELVLSADMPREDFMVSVYVGRDVGFYSDDFFDDDDEDEFEIELDDEESGNGKHAP